MNHYAKFERIIQSNCEIIHDLIDLEGLNATTISALYRHFVNCLPSVEELATQCAAGCAYCCHLRVTASLSEMIVIVEYLKDLKLIDNYRKKIEHKEKEFLGRREKGLDWWVRNRVPCLFLDNENQLCEIYEVRPFVCRGYHSLDVEICKKGFLKKQAVKIPCFPDLKRSREIFSISLERAMSQYDTDSKQMELSSTIVHFLH